MDEKLIGKKGTKGDKSLSSASQAEIAESIEIVVSSASFFDMVSRETERVSTEEYLTFSGRASIADLVLKFRSKSYKKAVKLCLIVLLRGKAFHKYIKEPNAQDMVKSLVKEFDIQVNAPDRSNKNNRLDTVIAALAPIMLVCSHWVNKNMPERLVVNDNAYDGKLPAQYRWFGSVVSMPAAQANVLLPLYESWCQWYIGVRRRPGTELSDRQKRINYINRVIERSWWGRQLCVFSESAKAAWINGDAHKIEMGKELSAEGRQLLEKNTGMVLFKQYPRAKGNNAPAESTINQMKADKALKEEFHIPEEESKK